MILVAVKGLTFSVQQMDGIIDLTDSPLGKEAREASGGNLELPEETTGKKLEPKSSAAGLSEHAQNHSASEQLAEYRNIRAAHHKRTNMNISSSSRASKRQRVGSQSPSPSPSSCSLSNSDGSANASLSASSHSSSSGKQSIIADLVGKPSYIHGSLRVLTYNIWFDHLEMRTRMQSIASIIVDSEADVVGLQEVTPESLVMLTEEKDFMSMYNLVKANFGSAYFCALFVKKGRPFRNPQWKPYSNSIMGRGCTSCEVEIYPGKHVNVGTTHLESFAGRHFTGAAERPIQLQDATQHLFAKQINTIDIVGSLLFGDFNWKDPTAKADNDGNAIDFCHPNGEWQDAWKTRHEKDPGYTYDGKRNLMLSHWWRNRFDRILYHGNITCGMTMLAGDQPVDDNLTYMKVSKNLPPRELPIFPSDHFAVLSQFIFLHKYDY